MDEAKNNLKSADRTDVSVEQNRGLAEAIAAGKGALTREARRNQFREDKRGRIRKTLLASDGSDPNGFERIIGESDLVSINFLDRGRRAADAVCRIRVPGEGGGWLGTGFLVGPRLLMTNNHVLSSPAEASQAEAEFGYEHDLEGVEKPAIQFNLAPDEIFFTDIGHDVTFIAVAPYSEGGVPLQRYGHLPLIPLSGKALNGEWVTLIQHPNGQAKQIAIRSNQIIELKPEEAAGTDLKRVIHYVTDTEPGSSGAPVLNDQWQVIALHHKAVPAPGTKFTKDGKPLKATQIKWIANEGIRISAIYGCLQAQRFTSTDAAGALQRLERGMGTVPLVASPPAGPENQQEADRKPLDKGTWTKLAAKLGYDPKFLSHPLDLDAILDKQKNKAAKLKGSNAVALDYLHFSVVIAEERKFPLLTAVNIDGGKLTHPGERKDTWRQDIRMDGKYQPNGDFYEKGKGDDKVQFSRGHLVRRLDPCWGTKEEAETAEMHTFHYSNATPQVQHYNDVEWGDLEDYVLDRIQTKEKLMTVFTGPIFRDDDPLYGKNRNGGPWRIPTSYWKIAVIQKAPGQIAAAAFIIGQTQYIEALYEAKVFTRLTPYTFAELQSQKIQTTVRTIEAETKLNFAALHDCDSVAALESTRQTRFVFGPGDIVI